MKTTITAIFLGASVLTILAQHTEGFETFTLSSNSAYSSSASVPFQNSNAIFQHTWENNFDYWAGGFAYTNKYDSSTAGSANLFGVKSYKGANNSDIYVVGNHGAVVKLKNPQTSVHGFHITNTTYAYKSMRIGDNFAKKFGGASGNDPDFFKIVVKGYQNGTLVNDSVEFYLADFRFPDNSSDYILDSWQYVNTMKIGIVDSIQFLLRSSDVGTFGMNTPAFFAIDDFVTGPLDGLGLEDRENTNILAVYPNPAQDFIWLGNYDNLQGTISYKVTNAAGQAVKAELTHNGSRLDTSRLPAGVYIVEISTEHTVLRGRFIRSQE